MPDLLIYKFSQKVLERVYFGSIVNIRNECIIGGLWGMNGTRDKHIAREPRRGSQDLFVPVSDAFPMNQEKRH